MLHFCYRCRLNRSGWILFLQQEYYWNYNRLQLDHNIINIMESKKEIDEEMKRKSLEIINENISKFEKESIFPVHITLEHARESINGRAEFFEKVQDDLIIFNYKYCSHSTFPNPKLETDPHKAIIILINK